MTLFFSQRCLEVMTNPPIENVDQHRDGPAEGPRLLPRFDAPKGDLTYSRLHKTICSETIFFRKMLRNSIIHLKKQLKNVFFQIEKTFFLLTAKSEK